MSHPKDRPRPRARVPLARTVDDVGSRPPPTLVDTIDEGEGPPAVAAVPPAELAETLPERPERARTPVAGESTEPDGTADALPGPFPLAPPLPFAATRVGESSDFNESASGHARMAIPVMPFRPRPGVGGPTGGRGLRADLTLEQFASLVAELEHGAPEVETQRRYGLDEVAFHRETAAWGQRFAESSETYRSWLACYETYLAYLRGGG